MGLGPASGVGCTCVSGALSCVVAGSREDWNLVVDVVVVEVAVSCTLCEIKKRKRVESNKSYHINLSLVLRPSQLD